MLNVEVSSTGDETTETKESGGVGEDPGEPDELIIFKASLEDGTFPHGHRSSVKQYPARLKILGSLLSLCQLNGKLLAIVTANSST